MPKYKPVIMKFANGERYLHVGQQCVIKNVNKSFCEFVKLIKIGNKIATFKDESGAIYEFYFTGREKSQYSHNSIYSSYSEYKKELKTKEMKYFIRNFVNDELENINFEQIESIYLKMMEILKEKKK